MLDETPTSETTADAVRYASWGARAGALALDYLPGIAVIATMAVLAATASSHKGWPWWVFTMTAALAGLAMLVNRVLLPSLIGWSLGRAVFGIRVTTSDGQPAGSVRLLGRELAHVLDTAALFIGWLWPLWDRRNRTFADHLLRTEVRAQDTPAPPHNVRRIAARVIALAALLCVAGGGLGYWKVYLPQRQIEQARASIAEQGPRIVEQMLSYGSATIVDDFARAQTLATDAYRPLLIAQQQAVQKTGVKDNEYWAVSSAVLSATPDRAAMLLALQGQRGADPKDLKFITATVRADFEKTNDRWRVAVLTVLKKPQMAGSTQ
jgi:Mce-associated membrane protein